MQMRSDAFKMDCEAKLLTLDQILYCHPKRVAHRILSLWVNEITALPWLNYQFVRVVDISVGFLSVDVFQNINPWHSAPPSQFIPPAGFKVFFWENVVLYQEDACLYDRDTQRMEIKRKYKQKYQ